MIGAADQVADHAAGQLQAPFRVILMVAQPGAAMAADIIMRAKFPLPRADQQDILARDLDLAKLEEMTTEIAFAEVIDTAPKFLDGAVRGRIVIPVTP